MLIAVAVSATAWAEGVRVSAQVDKTTVDVGAQVTLTITIEGDFAKVDLKPFEFPKAFQVLAPIVVGIGDIAIAAPRAAGNLIEIRQEIWCRCECLHHHPDHQGAKY